MKKTILIFLLALGFSAGAAAQNRIDRLVEQFSASGDCKFTSVVERNPKTRAVEKVVKTLETCCRQGANLRAAFHGEADKGSFSEKKENHETTLILTTQNAKSNRIYMMKYRDGAYSTAKVTIIINIK
jgi:hypothetical protein